MQIKYCPSCGHPSFNSNNTKHWQCSQCGFQYFHNMASAVAGLIICDDEILLTQRKFEPGKGKLDLPGGFVDYGESLEEAMARECYEELTIKNEKWQYLCSFANEYHYADVLYHTQDAFFITHLSSKPNILPQDDVANAFWVKAEQLDLSKVAFSSVRKALALWLMQG